MKTIAGYTDRISVAPGERIRFKVSCEGGGPTYTARLVRLICTDDHPQGPGLVERPVPSAIDGTYPARRQPIHTGSCVIVPPHRKLDGLASFTLAAWVWPTLPGGGRQTIMGTWTPEAGGIALEMDERGALALRLDDAVATTGVPLLAREWCRVAATYDARTGAVRLLQEPLAAYPGVPASAAVTARLPKGWKAARGASFVIAAHLAAGEAPRGGHYNGKIESPRLASRVLSRAQVAAATEAKPTAAVRRMLLAAWDFARETPTERIVDVAGGLHGRALNLPTRAMTGHAWDGRVHDWRAAPAQYGAIHFHDDDLYDAGWADDFALTLPRDLPSGVYAARLENGHDPEHVVFFVRPGRWQRKAKIAFLASTATYMAYANFRVMNRSANYEAFQGALLQIGNEDIFLNDHVEYGDSTYGLHTDGSGISLSSRLRSIVNMRPNAALWAFGGDMYVVAWLDALGYEADIVTDEDLHREGAALLRPYRAVLTGCHPEYVSREMWDAVDRYTATGGRLLYLGGNGFYWRIAFHPTLPGVIEVRRAEDGTRAWACEPGEYYMSFTGEYGGMWRRQDRTPNRLLGVGFTAQGFDCGSYYRRTAASRDPRVAFLFEGIGADELIGDFGIAGGGAAGQELDRYDRALGSPPDALIVASSEQHTDNMILVNEELLGMHLKVGGTENADVRADIVFFDRPGGGAVFSTGSISWPSSLPCNGFRNNVSRMTANALDRFLDPRPFRPRPSRTKGGKRR